MEMELGHNLLYLTSKSFFVKTQQAFSKSSGN